jgi:hypothetical protein
LTCPESIAATTDAGECTYTFAPEITDRDVTDNCTEFDSLGITYQAINPDGSISGVHQNGDSYSFEVGVSQISWTVVDDEGNSSSCLQEVVVTDEEAPEFVDCPTETIELENTEGLCGYQVDGQEFDWSATDNCEVVSMTNDYTGSSSLANVVFPVGSTTVTWTATDASGNSTGCTFTVVVSDTEDPVFVNCPEDVTFTSGLIQQRLAKAVWCGAFRWRRTTAKWK